MNQLFRSPDTGLFGRRLREARGARTPVVVLTGFLGAGKTTLLRHFLESEAGQGTAVIINEFGKAGIDDALLRASTDETVLLGNGCLCCNMRSDLQLALRKLLGDRERGLVPHFKRVVIETSGFADLGPILRTFATDRALGAECHVEGVIAVVDSVNGLANLERFAEARSQVMLADRIVISKTDLSDQDTRARLQARLNELNPRASVITAERGHVAGGIFTTPAEVEFRNPLLSEAIHSDGIASFTLTWRRPLPWPVVAQTMETLLALRGRDLLRVKGLLSIEGCTGPVVLQAVQHLAHPPVELQSWPDGDRSSRLVFITRGIAQTEVAMLFDAIGALHRGG